VTGTIVTVDQILLRRLGSLAPIVGGLCAAMGLVVIALVVNRSGCGGGEFDCEEKSIYVGGIALIPGVLIAIGVLWVAALTPTDDGSAKRSLGRAFVLGVGGAIAWVLLSTPIGWVIMVRGDAAPEGGQPIRADALAISATAVGAVVMLIGIVAVRAARCGLKAVGWFILVGCGVSCGDLLLFW
jgi:hypothetical protein